LHDGPALPVHDTARSTLKHDEVGSIADARHVADAEHIPRLYPESLIRFWRKGPGTQEARVGQVVLRRVRVLRMTENGLRMRLDRGGVSI
jgi:hypothetical protein